MAALRYAHVPLDPRQWSLDIGSHVSLPHGDVPMWPLLIIAPIIVVAAGLKLASLLRGMFAPPRDEVRLYTHAQRMEATARCGGRCEHKPMFWFRCRETKGLQGDHIYPWSKGGRTIESNLQMLCGPHNRRKTNSVPSHLYMWRLERRRRRYFPPGSDPKIVWR